MSSLLQEENRFDLHLVTTAGPIAISALCHHPSLHLPNPTLHYNTEDRGLGYE